MTTIIKSVCQDDRNSSHNLYYYYSPTISGSRGSRSWRDNHRVADTKATSLRIVRGLPVMNRMLEKKDAEEIGPPGGAVLAEGVC